MNSHDHQVSFSEARTHFAEIANEVAYAGRRTVVTRRGEKLIAIVSIEDLEMIEAIESKIDIEDARKALVDVEENGTIPWEEIRNKLNL